MRSFVVCVAALILIGAGFAFAWSAGLFALEDTAPAADNATGRPVTPAPLPAPPTVTGGTGLAQATFGNGCFWCTEAIFQQLKGVQSVVSGYSGGTVKDPTYREVCAGTTGHAEAIHITYDAAVVSYPELLETFWNTHDPTTLNRQGHDVGTQYRSVIFYHDAGQRKLAEQYKRKLDEADVFNAPIVTEIVPFSTFYPAEDYHQNFFNDHPHHPYCRAVIAPKLEKLRKVFQR